jgi:hypothetical protein
VGNQNGGVLEYSIQAEFRVKCGCIIYSDLKKKKKKKKKKNSNTLASRIYFFFASDHAIPIKFILSDG